jgi:hypothetical protein
VVGKQIPLGYVVNDVWFASAENMMDLKRHFVMPLTINRKLGREEKRMLCAC